jgi:hypothetical protein
MNSHAKTYQLLFLEFFPVPDCAAEQYTFVAGFVRVGFREWFRNVTLGSGGAFGM